MKAFYNTIFVFYFIVILSQIVNSFKLITDTQQIPTPSPLGKLCDEKLMDAINQSQGNGIRKCYETYYEDRNENRVSIVEMMKTASGTDCCSFWTFFKCIANFESTICTKMDEKNAFDEFIKEFITFMEKSRCKQLPFSTDKCKAVETTSTTYRYV
jgi:hypothetical protein